MLDFPSILRHHPLDVAGALARRFRILCSNIRTLCLLPGEMRHGLPHERAILVHQMGKVGSSSVVQSLNALSLPEPVYHVHCLNPVTRTRLWKTHVSLTARPIPAHLLLSKRLSKHIKRNGHRDVHWKVISLTRDPIAVVVSAFFQVCRLHIPRFEERVELGNISLDELTTVFFGKFSYHDWPLTWFDCETKAVWDIDVFATPFPGEKGYQIWRREQVDLMVIRLESLTNCAAMAFEDFLGLRTFELIQANMASDKNYGELYSNWKSVIEFPSDYIENMYNHKYACHFYTDDERERFKRKWREVRV